MINRVEVLKLSKKHVSHAIQYLRLHEHACVSLMSRLLKFNEIKSQTAYIVVEKKIFVSPETIKGVFLITDYGIILHHVLHCDIINLVTPLLKDKPLFSLAGIYESSLLFESSLSLKPSIIYDYYLMTYTIHEAPTKPNKLLEEKFHLLKCSKNDMKELFTLQKSYQIEEVLPPGKTISDKMCKNLLKTRLEEQDVFAIKDCTTGRYVAMAGTNAKGVDFIQLGGIYTDISYRNLGLSQMLLNTIIAGSTKNISLFVRTENFPAIKAYTNTGFIKNGSYRICYM